MRTSYVFSPALIALLLIACDSKSSHGQEVSEAQLLSGEPIPGTQIGEPSTGGTDSPVVIDFNDLGSFEVVAPNRYLAKLVQIFPSSGTAVGSFGIGPCDGSRALRTRGFTGPSILLNFTVPVKNVSIEAGDFGPSDKDIMTLTAFSGPLGTGGVVGSDTKTLGFLHATRCLNLAVSGAGIMSATITSVSTGFGRSFPNSIFQDNLDYCVVPNVDIKPGSFPNSINPKSNGVVPVAILGSVAFDVTTIDVTTLTFGPSGALPVHDLTKAGHLQDVNGDNILDLVSHYRQKETGLIAVDTSACISGLTTSGVPFEGCDSVRVLEK